MRELDETMPERQETASSWFLEFMLAILMPPIAVLLNRGPGREFVISIPLTVLGYIPGILYAFYIIFSGMHEMGAAKEEDYDRGEGGMNKNEEDEPTEYKSRPLY